jgi:hypothetical protein
MKRFATEQTLRKELETKKEKPIQKYKFARFEVMKSQVSVLAKMIDSQTEEDKSLYSEMIETIVKSNFNEFFKTLIDLKRNNENKVSTEFYNRFFNKCNELITLEEEAFKNGSLEAQKEKNKILDNVARTLRTKIFDLLDCLIIIKIFSKRRSTEEKKKLLKHIEAFSAKPIDKDVG